MIRCTGTSPVLETVHPEWLAALHRKRTVVRRRGVGLVATLVCCLLRCARRIIVAVHRCAADVALGPLAAQIAAAADDALLDRARRALRGSPIGRCALRGAAGAEPCLSLIHISEPTRLLSISYAVFCLKKKKT